MKKRLQGLIVGILIGATLSGGVAFAATKTLDAHYNNIKIVVDGKEFTPKDAGGNVVDPFIVDGTTYLPVRAVASALGKEVYWDGPNYTVYLGNMNGTLEYPSLRLKDLKLIGGTVVGPVSITDQYGNTYGEAYPTNSNSSSNSYETLLNMKYSKFKATVVVAQGAPNAKLGTFKIELDGKTIYTSEEIDGIGRAFDIEVDVTGGNAFKFTGSASNMVYLANAGFYQ